MVPFMGLSSAVSGFPLMELVCVDLLKRFKL